MLPPLPKNTLGWAGSMAQAKSTGMLDVSEDHQVQRQCRVDRTSHHRLTFLLVERQD